MKLLKKKQIPDNCVKMFTDKNGSSHLVDEKDKEKLNRILTQGSIHTGKCKEMDVCKNIPRTVTCVWAPTEFDLQGYCPHCGADVMNCFNKTFCGKCGEKIKWPQKES